MLKDTLEVLENLKDEIEFEILEIKNSNKNNLQHE